MFRLSVRKSGKHRIGAVCVTVLLTLALVACGDDEDPPGIALDPTVTPTIEPTQPAEVPLDIAPPVWTNGINPADGSPIDNVEVFPTDAMVIYAAFQTSEISTGTEFTIAWVMNDVPVPGLNPTLAITADTPPGWIEIHLDRTSETAWPEGELTIQLKIGENVVSTGTVELRDS